MTKAEIVQELLDKGHITAEKAVVLLTNESINGIRYIPYQQNPYWPNPPTWIGDPNLPYCGTTTTGGPVTADGLTTNLQTKNKENE